ncbi:hypothetical protein ACN27G_30940 [Plantactinospora sp. WMMB334]|uniref:hypothetical protein n=1 Tax=Plantactinospora sp. WMMB334 TaxID=3404119 RepID=UPI003B9617E2
MGDRAARAAGLRQRALGSAYDGITATVDGLADADLHGYVATQGHVLAVPGPRCY